MTRLVAYLIAFLMLVAPVYAGDIESVGPPAPTRTLLPDAETPVRKPPLFRPSTVIVFSVINTTAVWDLHTSRSAFAEFPDKFREGSPTTRLFVYKSAPVAYSVMTAFSATVVWGTDRYMITPGHSKGLKIAGWVLRGICAGAHVFGAIDAQHKAAYERARH